jgi:hypothetical protein
VTAAKHLGALACHGCGRERAEADDKATWIIVVAGGVLTEVACPECEGEAAASDPGNVAVDLSDHAVVRYHERVRPGLTLDQAGDELERLLAAHGRWAERPDWVSDELPANRWVLLGDGIAFPVEGDVMVSCVTRAGYSSAQRRFATDVNGYDRRARRHKESQHVRRLEGRAAKRSRKRDKGWREDAA